MSITCDIEIASQEYQVKCKSFLDWWMEYSKTASKEALDAMNNCVVVNIMKDARKEGVRSACSAIENGMNQINEAYSDFCNQCHAGHATIGALREKS